jgi:hypothetical protein
MKTESLLSQKSSSKTSSSADAEIFTLHGLLLAHKPLTKTRTLGPKKSSKKPVVRQTMTSSAQINYSWQTNPWWKLSPCYPKNHPRKPVLRLTLKSSLYMDYCWLTNRWRKLGPSDPKNHPGILVVRLTLTSSAEINYSWQTNRWWKLSRCVPKIILETQFYRWRWNLQCT